MAQNELRITVNRSEIVNLTENARNRYVVVLRKVSKDIEADAKTRAPFKTGFLRNSIGARVINQFNAEVTVAANYAAYLEHGTRKMAARPFFSPAVEANRDVFTQAVAQVVRDAADESRVE